MDRPMKILSKDEREQLMQEFLVGRKKMLGLLQEGEVETERPRSVRELAQKYGVSHQTVYNIAASRGWKTHNGRSLKRIDEELKKNIKEDHENGVSPMQIGSKYGMSFERVRRVIIDLTAEA